MDYNVDCTIVQARIEALSFGGAGVGTVVDGTKEQIGKKVFITHTVPEEIVEATVLNEKPRYLQARLLKVLSPSSDRTFAPCPVFGKCGGCSLQHVDGKRQRQEKLKMLGDMLLKQAGISPVQPIELLGDQLPFYHYRRRISLHVDRSGQIGYYRPGTGELVSIRECLLATQAINYNLQILLQQIPITFAALARIIVEEHGRAVFVVFELKEQIVEPQIEVEKLVSLLAPLLCNFQISDRKVLLYCQENHQRVELPSVPAGHFSQVNFEGNQLLVENIVSNIKGDKVTDLYAGAGNFSIPLVQNGKKVVAVEIDSALVDYGRRVAQESGVVGDLRFIKSSAERYIKKNKLTGSILIDPPRSGAAVVVSALSPSLHRELIYVSCNLPTFVRDAAALKAKGYNLEGLFMIDMFPQTSYLEALAIFRG